MTFSGKWAVTWHDMTWGPFDTQSQAEYVLGKVKKYRHAPQEFSIFPLWEPSFIEEVAQRHEP